MSTMSHLRALLAALALAALALAAACGKDSSSGDDDDNDDDDNVDVIDGSPGAIDAAPPADAPVAAFCTPASGTNVRLVEVARDFDDPVFVTAPPGDPRLFVVEQRGRIRIVKDGQTLETPFLELASSKLEANDSEEGLLGLAFHPDFAANGTFYIHYTAQREDSVNLGRSVVAEYKVSSNPDVADPNSERVLVEADQPFTNHNGGMIAFGPKDGYLYIALGDGGDGNDPDNRAQNRTLLLGKILRIDVDSGNPYGIPATNPFVGEGGGVREEIWAYGLRNPWRFSFDRETGDLYIGDVGQDGFEEIDYQPASSTGGENYGWRIFEANNCRSQFGDCDTPYTQPLIVEPALDEPADCITGGYVYRGSCMPDLQGTYFYGDHRLEYIKSVRVTDGVAGEVTDLSVTLNTQATFNGIPSFGEDGFGELYVISYGNGRIYRFELAN